MYSWITKRVKKFYNAQRFLPSAFGILFNPYWFVRRNLYKAILANKKYLKGRLLDFGCGDKPYKELLNVKEYIGLDIVKSGHRHKNEQIDVFYDGKTIPFGNNHFDSVFSSEAFEHVSNLDEIIKELHRVLKPGGYILITVPFVWNEHEAPLDYARYTSFGLKRLLVESGFKIVSFKKSANYVETLFQMWDTFVFESIIPPNFITRTILIPLFIAPATILGIIFSKLLPKNNSLYLSNIVVAQKK